MPGNYRSIIAERLHRAGWDLRRWPGLDEPAYRRCTLLSANGVDLVVDVGANVGQYSSGLREHGYDGLIVSLEPTQAAFAQLAALAAKDDRWTALRTAAGAEKGNVTINLAANSVSSSVLRMLDRHAVAAPDSLYTGTEMAPIDRLDSLVGSWVADAVRPFLKIDVQGFERPVLEGSSTILGRFVGVELELCLVPLYEDQVLWREHIDYMESAGFKLVSMTPAFWDDASGELLAADGIFLQ
jgi:FkbM family methyltransferase